MEKTEEQFILRPKWFIIWERIKTQEKNMYLKKLINPILFQGSINKKQYFEGWYYKQVSKDQKSVISFIPGISTDDNDPHSFIQYILVTSQENGEKEIKTGYVRFPLEFFKYSDNPFKIQIAESSFTEESISVNFHDDDMKIDGNIELGPLTPIERTMMMPNIMGYFAYIPKMECYHGIVSMNHSLKGNLKFNEEEIDFENGKGYIEKDWGTSFPKKYIWIQCNNFKNYTTSVVASLADIPFMGRSFQGFLCNLTVEGEEYRFATYNNSKFKLEKANNEVIILVFENSKALLRIEADLKQQGELIAPKSGKMEKRIKEGLSGIVKINLYNKKNKNHYEDIGLVPGIEIVEN